MLGQAMNPIIRSDGAPRFAMISTPAGAVADIALDPVFIFLFKWENDGGGGGNAMRKGAEWMRARMK